MKNMLNRRGIKTIPASAKRLESDMPIKPFSPFPLENTIKSASLYKFVRLMSLAINSDCPLQDDRIFTQSVNIDVNSGINFENNLAPKLIYVTSGSLKIAGDILKQKKVTRDIQLE